MLQIFSHLFGWMQWTMPSGIFIGGIFLSIFLIGIYEAYHPVYENDEGFLPIPTTPGDKLFISILFMIAVFLLWMAIFKTGLLWVLVAVEIMGVSVIVWKG